MEVQKTFYRKGGAIMKRLFIFMLMAMTLIGCGTKKEAEPKIEGDPPQSLQDEIDRKETEKMRDRFVKDLKEHKDLTFISLPGVKPVIDKAPDLKQDPKEKNTWHVDQLDFLMGKAKLETDLLKPLTVDFSVSKNGETVDLTKDLYTMRAEWKQDADDPLEDFWEQDAGPELWKMISGQKITKEGRALFHPDMKDADIMKALKTLHQEMCDDRKKPEMQRYEDAELGDFVYPYSKTGARITVDMEIETQVSEGSQSWPGMKTRFYPAMDKKDGKWVICDIMTEEPH